LKEKKKNSAIRGVVRGMSKDKRKENEPTWAGEDLGNRRGKKTLEDGPLQNQTQKSVSLVIHVGALKTGGGKGKVIFTSCQSKPRNLSCPHSNARKGIRLPFQVENTRLGPFV